MDRQRAQARPGGARQPPARRRGQPAEPARTGGQPAGRALPGADAGRTRRRCRAGAEPGTDAAQRHLGRRARRGRCRGAAAAGQPGADAAAGQGHPAIHGPATGGRQPAAAGRGAVEHRRRGAPGPSPAHRHRQRTGRRQAQGRRQPAGQGQGAAAAAIHAERPDLQLGPHRLCRWRPPRQRRRAVHHLPADLRPGPDLGAPGGAAQHGAVRAGERPRPGQHRTQRRGRDQRFGAGPSHAAGGAAGRAGRHQFGAARQRSVHTHRHAGGPRGGRRRPGDEWRLHPQRRLHPGRGPDPGPAAPGGQRLHPGRRFHPQ